MKFGQNLHCYQVVEWAPYYIDYQALKQLYKAAKRLAIIDQGEVIDLTDFGISLEQNLSRARLFYNDKYELLQQRRKALHDYYGIIAITDWQFASELEVVTIKAAFLELRNSLKQLLWYWLVNFDKTIGALAKFKEDLGVSDADLALRTKSVVFLRQINELLDQIQSENQKTSRGSGQTTLLQRKYVNEGLSFLPNAFAATERDDTFGMDQQLRLGRKNMEADVDSRQQVLFALLYFSAVYGSQRCIERLLSDIESLQNYGSHIHWLIIQIGQRKKWEDQNTQIHRLTDTAIPCTTRVEVTDQLAHIITKLGYKLEKALLTKDSYGRIPLHHAVQYDMPTVCREILKHMRENSEPRSGAGPSPSLVPDLERLTSLDLAVLHENVTISSILLEDFHHRIDQAKIQKGQKSLRQVLPGNLLAYALRLKSFEIVRLLHRSIIDVMHRDHNGNTALHLAVRSRKSEYVAEILQGWEGNQDVDLDARENVFGGTPLILASARGDLAIVELLLRAGADPTTQDHFGWRAKDHAALRGWLPMARTLEILTAEHSKGDHDIDDLLQRKQATVKKTLSTNFTEQNSPKISPSQSQIFVNLGVLDTYQPITAVDMSPFVWPDPYNPQREADFHVEVQAINGDQASNIIQLPILEDKANKPWRFLTKNPKEFKLAFNVYHSETSGHKGNSLIGSAVALLDCLKQGLGPTRESLIRNFTIPVLHKNTLDLIGTITFYFLIVTPFLHPNPGQVIKQELSFPGSNGLPIIGHRGIGQNDPGRRQLQIGENTIESFLIAKDLGASYIELTKDDVPIIYHDFLMSETGIDAPLHSLNLEQFMYISDAQSAEEDLSFRAEQRYLERSGDQIKNEHRRRSHSLGIYEQLRAKGLIDRMKHTFEFKLNEAKGFNSYKGNIRSEYIQASFATLDDLFTKLPETVKFDIEIKYPMLFEAHDWGMETSGVEANHLVDRILDRVYRLASKRSIFFSSFSPEVCILLSHKQHIYPVFFLTESGHIPSSDARADSLQEAIWFAKSWRLAGVISRSEPLVVSPQLIRYVQDAGLLCVSWGGLNDVPEHAKTQANAGLDAIITNNVNLISQTLSHAQNTS